MSLDRPINIFGLYFASIYSVLLVLNIIVVQKPVELNFQVVRESLMRMVPLCLDSDPSLIPLSCKPLGKTCETPPPLDFLDDLEVEERDPDDFSFWSERQAKRICGAIEQTFEIEYAPEVVVADANLTALANRILLSKEVLTT